MSIKIEYEILHDPTRLMERAREEASKEGARVEGTATSGRVIKGGLLPVEGEYLVRGRHITLTITKIPFLLSWNSAHSIMMDWLKKNDRP